MHVPDSRRPLPSAGAWRDAGLHPPMSIDPKRILERAKGIEPSYAAWEAAVLPLNYARDRLAILI
jgi:hypothetical protein